MSFATIIYPTYVKNTRQAVHYLIRRRAELITKLEGIDRKIQNLNKLSDQILEETFLYDAALHNIKSGEHPYKPTRERQNPQNTPNNRNSTASPPYS